MIDTLFNIYAASLLVYFLLAVWVTWVDKGISGKNLIYAVAFGITPVFNVVASIVIVWIMLKDNERFNKFLTSSIFTRK